MRDERERNERRRKKGGRDERRKKTKRRAPPPRRCGASPLRWSDDCEGGHVGDEGWNEGEEGDSWKICHRSVGKWRLQQREEEGERSPPHWQRPQCRRRNPSQEHTEGGKGGEGEGHCNTLTSPHTLSRSTRTDEQHFIPRHPPSQHRVSSLYGITELRLHGFSERGGR